MYLNTSVEGRPKPKIVQGFKMPFAFVDDMGRFCKAPFTENNMHRAASSVLMNRLRSLHADLCQEEEQAQLYELPPIDWKEFRTEICQILHNQNAPHGAHSNPRYERWADRLTKIKVPASSEQTWMFANRCVKGGIVQMKPSDIEDEGIGLDLVRTLLFRAFTGQTDTNLTNVVLTRNSKRVLSTDEMFEFDEHRRSARLVSPRCFSMFTAQRWSTRMKSALRPLFVKHGQSIIQSFIRFFRSSPCQEILVESQLSNLVGSFVSDYCSIWEGRLSGLDPVQWERFVIENVLGQNNEKMLLKEYRRN